APLSLPRIIRTRTYAPYAAPPVSRQIAAENQSGKRGVVVVG
ncbi:unnamed protein product, partial [Ectocarpus sp. 8 AP-2014]